MPKTQTRSRRVSRTLQQKPPNPDFENLKAIAQSIVQTLGEHSCEVIIHDLTDLEHSIIWVEGNVTSRCIGGAMTDLGISKVRAGDFQHAINYVTHTEDGRTLKSCSVFLRDSAGKCWGAFCINVDITPFVGMVN